MTFDPYEILGVSKEASQEEIKKSYRKLARKHHPDVNPGDKSAEDKFKQISEAYDILGDEAKRREYDQLGQQAFYEQAFDGAGYQRPDFGGGVNFEDLFGDLFGARGQSAGGGGFRTFFTGSGQGGGFHGFETGPRPGGDLSYGLEITFHEAVFGAEKTLEFEIPAGCASCGGTGLDNSSFQACSKCNGTGRVAVKQGKAQVMTQCPGCGGSGRVGQPRQCPACGGLGQTVKRQAVKARIPAGVDNGSRVRLAGKGRPGAEGGPAGDLYLEIRVAPDPVFRRDGQDIMLTQDIPIFDAVLGGQVEVPTLTGRAKLKIPAGTQAGRKFRLKGQGVPATGKKPAGDLLVSVNVRVPEKLTPEARELFEKLRDIVPQTAAGDRG